MDRNKGGTTARAVSLVSTSRCDCSVTQSLPSHAFTASLPTPFATAFPPIALSLGRTRINPLSQIFILAISYSPTDARQPTPVATELYLFKKLRTLHFHKYTGFVQGCLIDRLSSLYIVGSIALCSLFLSLPLFSSPFLSPRVYT